MPQKTVVQLIGRLLGFFRADRSGNVAIIVAATLPLIVGITALVVEYGNGLVIQAQNQRVADLAAYAGAVAYSAGQSTTRMTAAAQGVAGLNGVASANLAVALVVSPAASSSQAVRATILVQQPLFLAPILGAGPSQAITSVSYAQLGSGAPDCILALSASQTGITLSGGTSISAPTCSVDSNASVSVPCGTSIAAKTLTFNSTSAPSQPCSGITAGEITKAATADPMLGNASLASAVARLASVHAMTMTAAPTFASGTSIDFAYDQASTIAQAAKAGCTAAFSGSTWVLACPGGGAYKFGGVTLGGGISVNFNTGASSTTSYSFGGPINNYGVALTFGPGTFNIGAGLLGSNGSTTSFGAGTFRIGKGTTACNSGGYYSICNSSTISFGGPSVFQLWAGIENDGGATLTLGTGTTNSFSIGPGGTGDALTLGGGSTLLLADALGSANAFQLVGNVTEITGGGSCLVLSAAAQHDIKGNFIGAGAVQLGAGVYTLDGYFALGGSGGGGGACNGSSFSLLGNGVSIVLSGTATPGAGSCAGQSFCIAAGYSNITLTSPTSGGTAKLAVIGPTSTGNATGATFAEGGSASQIAGLFYFPNGPLTMSGGAGLSGGAGCLQLVGSRVKLGGGAMLASACFSSGSSGKVRLVQ